MHPFERHLSKINTKRWFGETVIKSKNGLNLYMTGFKIRISMISWKELLGINITHCYTVTINGRTIR